VGRGSTGREVIELGELVRGGGEADLEAVGFTDPALPLCFLDSGDQVVADAHQSWPLGRVDAQQGAPEAAVLVDTRGSVGAAAITEGEFAALEVAEEFLPLVIGGGAVLPGGTQFAAAGEEGSVAVDGLLRVGRLVPHGGVEVAVPDDELGDVGGHAVHHGVGDEDPAEVVRDEPQRLSVGVGESAGGQRFVEEVADGRGVDRAVLGADPALEQQRQRRVEDPFVVVVGGHQRDRASLVAGPADDRAEHVGKFRRDDEQAFGVGLGLGDVQQGHGFAGAGKPVVHQAGMGQFGQFLDADAGEAQDLHGRPGPKTPGLLRG